MYSINLYLLNRDNLTQPIQMQVSKNKTLFSEFLYVFLKSRLTFEHFEKKDDPQSLCISEITDCKRRA